MKRFWGTLSLVLLGWGALYGQVTTTATEAPKPPQTTRDFFIAGHEAMDRGDELGLVEYFNKASQLATKDTDKAIALNNIGYFYLTRRNLDKAKEYLEKAASFDKTNKKPRYRSIIWNNLGQACEYQKDFAKAMSCYKKGCQADPTYEKPQLNREHLEAEMQTMAIPSKTVISDKAAGQK